MAKRKGDTSQSHFRWLVDGRSRNQSATADLFRIISANEHKLKRNVGLQLAAQELTSIAFSLWRAVFLSDTTGDHADQLADTQTFLISLISDNAILYATDKNARNWSFRYYLDNAQLRLRRLADSSLDLLEGKVSRPAADTEKEEWIEAEADFETALSAFDRIAQST